MIVALVGGLALMLGGADVGPETYEARKATAGRDARSQVDLALWCEARGLEREKIRHLSVAVLTDPSHAMARALLGLVEYRGKWLRPEAVADAIKVDVAAADLLAEYNGKRVAAPLRVDSQLKLAAWCESKGLAAEARAHLATVVRLDPGHAEAWKKLGYKKVGQRWMTDEQAEADRAEAEAMKGAERRWKPQLAKWRDALKDPRKRAEALEALGGLTDPRAVPWVWSSLAGGEPGVQTVAVQVFGQIDSLPASRALATMALSANSPEVRRRAVETLRHRDPREFAGMLVGLLRDPIKYEVRPVGGPGSPGALFVEGRQINVQRYYAPPAMPNLFPTSGAYVLDYDADGFLVANQMTPTFRSTQTQDRQTFGPSIGLRDFARYNPTDPTLAQAASDFRQNASAQYKGILAGNAGHRGIDMLNPAASQGLMRVNFKTTTTVTTNTNQTGFVQTPVGRMAAEYQKSAAVAQAQLANDVARIDRANAEIKATNALAEQVLHDVSGSDLGDDRDGWRAWWKNTKGFTYYLSSDKTPKETVVENVPLAYQPGFIPPASGRVVDSTTKVIAQRSEFDMSSMVVTHHNCFGAGTPVRTLTGPRAIETLSVGDLVLTQNANSGKLGYRPITVVYHNPPNRTIVITAAGAEIVSTPIHRFWIVGRGWVMAHELKEGDPIRTLDGVAKVTKIVPGPVQKVFNLDVEGDADYFAGEAAALVHDNTLPDLRQAPFDAPAAVASR